jgi:hypothetical protein
MKKQKINHEIMEREPKSFDNAMQKGKVKWQKTRSPMSHLTPPKKKRKK